jgi:serine/threonine-protein kinase RsbW
VFWLSPGRSVSLVVGDVVGRGLAAAMTMGQLRSAVRALATLARGPGQLLVALDEYSRRYGVGEMATVLYGQLDIVDCTLCFACAGHPPPLIHPAGAEPRFIWEGRSLPINAYPPPLERPQAEVPLSPGTSVLLYTDGLIEHRAQPADQGMEDLIRLVGRAACGSIPEAEPLGVMIESIARALADPRASDDRSLVGLRLTNG